MPQTREPRKGIDSRLSYLIRFHFGAGIFYFRIEHHSQKNSMPAQALSRLLQVSLLAKGFHQFGIELAAHIHAALQ